MQGSRPTWFTHVTEVQLDPAQEEKQAHIENTCAEQALKGRKIMLQHGFEHGLRAILQLL